MEIKELYRLYQQHPCITTDSRDCPEGSIFLALKGESFDGNKFAKSAIEKGCAFAIVDDQSAIPSRTWPVSIVGSSIFLLLASLVPMAKLLPKSLLLLYYHKSSMCSTLKETSITT